MEENLLIVHGGGPTAVLNASLYGAVCQARKYSNLSHIYGAENGTGGILKGKFLELENIEKDRLRLLLQTPGSAIGTSRDQLEGEDYERMAEILKSKKIRYVLFNGGNGTMETCGRLYEVCRRKNIDIRIMGIPKTTDNDIQVTDHSPGYGSAARYMAASVQELCADVRGLPIHVAVMEASGRNAGWIAAAAALAAEGGYGPDFIYFPEIPFDEERFINDIEQKLREKSGIVVVAGEGLKNADGQPIVKPVFRTGRATYFGDVSTYLANLVIQKLGYKARGEKPGLLGRASVSLQSSTDRDEAEWAGREACRAVMEGESGKMAAFRRISDHPYRSEIFLADISGVMLNEKTLPGEFINPRGNGVTDAFVRWCRPLIGGPLPEMISLNHARPGMAPGKS